MATVARIVHGGLKAVLVEELLHGERGQLDAEHLMASGITNARLRPSAIASLNQIRIASS